MRCFECGEENSPESVFCQNCGRRLRADAPAAAAEAAASDAEETVSGAADESAASDAEEAVSGAADESAEEEAAASDAEEAVNGAADGGERVVETSDDGSYRIVYEKNKICPICGEVLPPDANFCTNCSHKLSGEPKAKRKGLKAVIIGVIAAAVIAVIGIVCIVYPKLYDIEGIWVSQEESMSIFGITTGSYMVIDDDSLEYCYSSFFSEEYEYSYNAFTKTLNLYSNGRKTESIHLDWIDGDTFVILENGNTFSRVNDDDVDDGEKQYSI